MYLDKESNPSVPNSRTSLLDLGKSYKTCLLKDLCYQGKTHKSISTAFSLFFFFKNFYKPSLSFCLTALSKPWSQ